MAEIGRIGGLQRLNRDTPSDGLSKVEGKDPLNYAGQTAETGKPARNQKVDEVAKLYEKQFLREMTKAMRGTVQFGNDKPSMGEGIYREQLDNEYVESWGDQGGIGLSNLIYDQMMERYFNGPGQKLKDGGPIALTNRDITRVNRIPANAETASQVPLRVETKPSPDGSPTRLQSPWEATVLTNTKIDGKTSLSLGHPGGLKSTLIFQGVAGADVEAGKVLEKGKTIGILSPEVNSFFWNLSRPEAKTEATR